MKITNIRAKLHLTKEDIDNSSIMRTYLSSYQIYADKDEKENMHVVYGIKTEEGNKNPKLIAKIKLHKYATITWELDMKFVIHSLYKKKFIVTDYRVLDIANKFSAVVIDEAPTEGYNFWDVDNFTIELVFARLEDIEEFIEAEKYRKNNQK